MTVVFGSIPQSGSRNREGIVQYLAQFSLAEEKHLATYWEGWCLLLVSILAFERFLRAHKTATYEKQSWVGLSVLAAGLSLDELGSIRERAPFLFSSWGLSGEIWRYRSTRRAQPLSRIGREELRERGRAVGLAFSCLPRNLTFFTRRFSVVFFSSG
jgi:hypothetical protein